MKINLDLPQNMIRGLDWKKEVSPDLTPIDLMALIKIGYKGTNRLTLKKSPLKIEILDGDTLLGSLDDRGNMLIDDPIYSRYKSIRQSNRRILTETKQTVTEGEFNVVNVEMTQEERDQISNALRGATSDKVRKVFTDKYGDRVLTLQGNNQIDKDIFLELIKNTFGSAFNKFGEQLAKWSLDGTISDERPDEKRRFIQALEFLVEGHEDEYDPTFNGMKPVEITRLFAENVKEQSSRERAESEAMEETETDYEIVPIKTKEEAEAYYSKIAIDGTTSSSQWCITRGSYNSYVGSFDEGKAELFYFMLKKGYDDYKEVPEPGPSAPYDDFGLSMIAVSVKEDGSLKTATSRWNHSHGGNDNMFSESQLSRLAGRSFYKAFPPLTDPEERIRKLLRRSYPVKKAGARSLNIVDNLAYIVDNKELERDEYGFPYKIFQYYTVKGDNMSGYIVQTSKAEGNKEYGGLDQDLNWVFKPDIMTLTEARDRLLGGE